MFKYLLLFLFSFNIDSAVIETNISGLLELLYYNNHQLSCYSTFLMRIPYQKSVKFSDLLLNKKNGYSYGIMYSHGVDFWIGQIELTSFYMSIGQLFCVNGISRTRNIEGEIGFNSYWWVFSIRILKLENSSWDYGVKINLKPISLFRVLDLSAGFSALLEKSIKRDEKKDINDFAIYKLETAIETKKEIFKSYLNNLSIFNLTNKDSTFIKVLYEKISLFNDRIFYIEEMLNGFTQDVLKLYINMNYYNDRKVYRELIDSIYKKIEDNEYENDVDFLSKLEVTSIREELFKNKIETIYSKKINKDQKKFYYYMDSFLIKICKEYKNISIESIKEARKVRLYKLKIQEKDLQEKNKTFNQEEIFNKYIKSIRLI